jgi:hypothetical protein
MLGSMLRNLNADSLKDVGSATMGKEIPFKYQGWWRIVETSQWVNDGLDLLGPALISLTGYADRIRMHALLAYINCKSTKSGVSFAWAPYV